MAQITIDIDSEAKDAGAGATPASDIVRRCWAGVDASPLMLDYHDREWGVPLHGDRELFAKLVLDGFQAGLSWSTILNKRAHFLEVFDGFDPERMARYDRRRIAKLLKDPGIVRNRQKVESAVSNARALLEFQEKEGSFDAFLWKFVGGAPKQNARRSLRQLPARTRESDRMSESLVSRGFRFVGPTICYAFMQAVGMVNDHLVTCFRHAELQSPVANATK
ncbi:MAG: DNA-3-methyladenine glycosylase I [Deltaproteobacteria bacterium]|nr:MAG: DNA-3-methyladenine glycosylase I [Deltaproteobacteria bacterium]